MIGRERRSCDSPHESGWSTSRINGVHIGPPPESTALPIGSPREPIEQICDSPTEHLYRFTKGLGDLARLFLSLFSVSQLAKTPNGPNSHKNAALVLPKFGLTVEKRPGAAIEGGSTRIHLPADSELTQVKQNTISTAREFRGIESECLRLIEEIQVRPRASHQNDHCADESIPEYRTGPLEVPDYESDREGDTNCLGYLYDHTINVISPRPKKPVGTTSPNKILQAPQYREAQNNADGNNHAPIVGVRSPNRNYGFTLTAREFQRGRKQGFRVSQSDGQILTPLTAICNEKTTRNRVSKCGQGMDSTTIKNPGKRSGGQTGVSQQIKHQGKLTIPHLESIAFRHWSSTYQRLKKVSQSVGGELRRRRKVQVHPTGTPIYKYRTNQHFPRREKPSGIGPGDSQFALTPRHGAQSDFHAVTSENIFFKRK